MGYLKRETVRLVLPSNEEYWVDIKSKLSHGDENFRLSKVMDVHSSMEGVEDGGDAQMQTKFELAAMQSATLHRAIVKWNLSDEQDNPLLLTPANIDELDGGDADYILEEINERNPRRTKKVKNA